jgi:hypothetical protein
VKRPNSLDLNFSPISLVSEQSIKSPGLRVLLRLVSGKARRTQKGVALFRGGERGI